jgi:hypothetical protein
MERADRIGSETILDQESLGSGIFRVRSCGLTMRLFEGLSSGSKTNPSKLLTISLIPDETRTSLGCYHTSSINKGVVW